MSINPIAESSTSTKAKQPSTTAVQTLATAAMDVVPPLWPLQDYVAVNPFVNLTNQTLLEVRSRLRAVRDCELLPSWQHFRTLWQRGDFTEGDMRCAYERTAAEYPSLVKKCSPAELRSWLGGAPVPADQERHVSTASEAYDRLHGSCWEGHFINDVTWHCAAHYDRGQALWPNPWRDDSLYTAWRDAAMRSRRMDLLGVRGFRELVASLPAEPLGAIAALLARSEVPSPLWGAYFQCLMLSVFGWSAYIKYHVQRENHAGRNCDDLFGLLVIRLTYDVAFAQSHSVSPSEMCSEDAESLATNDVSPSAEALARYVLLAAAEQAYQRQLREKLISRPATAEPAAQSAGRAVQMAFCIDVRSEVMRRHLETLDASIETFGSAGFFGMPLEHIQLGDQQGAAQCPVLLEPKFHVHENIDGTSPAATEHACQRRYTSRANRKLWKAFQQSATACFSFVEALGWTYAGKLLTDSCGWTTPVPCADREGLLPGDKLDLSLNTLDGHPLPLEVKVELAAGLLRNLGLTAGFAPLVILCGHQADVVNNPYRAGLDCGACGGHSGAPNARVATRLLNDPAVRHALREQDIELGDETWFVPAVHHTTTDEVELLDVDRVPVSHGAQLAEVHGWLQQATERCRAERAQRLSESTANDVASDILRRSRDWAEVRPEWGLAGNAAFVVAPHPRIRGRNLGGRTFLHTYDYRCDPDGNVLELIMTAPMVVASWINLQYYASAVDPRAYGSGNKLIHNVVGQFGILEGNGGDLRTGLPWQSVHDGRKLQHLPQRLHVVIEAPRQKVQQIIEKHAVVRDLVSNGWLTLAVLDEETWHHWSNQRWVSEIAKSPPKPNSREVAAADSESWSVACAGQG